jgi:hypothetical protein
LTLNKNELQVDKIQNLFTGNPFGPGASAKPGRPFIPGRPGVPKYY